MCKYFHDNNLEHTFHYDQMIKEALGRRVHVGKHLIGPVAHCIISRQLKDVQLCAIEAVSSFTRQVNLPSAPS